MITKNEALTILAGLAENTESHDQLLSRVVHPEHFIKTKDEIA
jgi:hypothetical protein